MKTREFKESNYKALFFKESGKTYRLRMDQSKPIKRLRHPEFLDVKITSYCEGACPYCYMNSTSKDAHFKDIVGKVNSFFGPMTKNERPFQVAIGGGEPTSHPDFVELLETFDKLGIMPNYTTNGMIIATNPMDLIEATKKYCGGVAVSTHKHLEEFWKKAVHVLSKNGIKINLHSVISDKESIDYAIKCVEEFYDIVDHFVMLPLIPQGRAKDVPINWDYLVSRSEKVKGKLAFGALFHKNLKGSKDFKVSLYEPEAYSGFLDLMDMKLYNSSFDHTERE